MRTKIIKIVVKCILAVLCLASIPYYNVVFYSFEPNAPFSGEQFYNPYATIKGNWIKANFHAHSKLLGGLLHGRNTAAEMFETYDSLHYELPCLSNYNSLTDNSDRDFYLDVYEHGINAAAAHQLVINAETATKFDYPLFQFTSHKQHMINKLKTDNNLIALAHPAWKNSYSFSDLEVLQNYDLMEILSVNATSVHSWDHALSNGHVVWALGNDDAHDNEESSCGLAWTMIDVTEKTKENVVNSLKAGRSYATRGWMGQEMNWLENITVTEEGLYTIRLQRRADSITLLSDNGKIVATATDTDTLEYEIQPENTYVRAEVFETEEWNGYTKMYFNPVIRTTDGVMNASIREMRVSWVKTIVYFVFLVAFSFFLIRVIVKW